MVERSLALMHPCVYAELGAADPVPGIAEGLEREVRLLCPGRDAAEIVRSVMEEAEPILLRASQWVK